MVDTDFPQFRMLVRIKKAVNYSAEGMPESEKDICEYLNDHGFIKPTYEYTFEYEAPLEDCGPKITSYRITQEGRAQIFSYIAAFHKWWIPLVISIAALIIGIVI